MGGKYYRIRFDPNIENLWFLDEPLDENGSAVDARLFTKGEKYCQHGDLFIPQRERGKAADFSFGAFDMVVVKRNLLDAVAPLLGKKVQRIPVKVESADVEYDILNVLDVVECLDEELSEYTKWTKDDGRPDKIGQYRMVSRLVVDAGKAAGHKIFRVMGWKIALIIHEDIRAFLEQQNIVGIQYTDVSDVKQLSG